MSRRSRMQAMFPEEDMAWMYADLKQVQPLSVEAEQRWWDLRELLMLDPGSARAGALADEAFTAGGVECFDEAGLDFLAVLECPYLPADKAYLCRADYAVLVAPQTAMVLCETSGGTHVLADLAQGGHRGGLLDLDMDVLTSGAVSDALFQASLPEGFDPDLLA